MIPAPELVQALREVADDDKLIWEVARRAIEDQLIEMRDARMFVSRNNGLVVKEYDGTQSRIIRMGPEMAVTIALRAIADHLAAKIVAS